MLKSGTKGYYKFVASTYSSGNCFLNNSSAWEYLGEHYYIQLKDADNVTKTKYKYGEATFGTSGSINSIVLNGTSYTTSSTSENLKGIIIYSNVDGRDYKGDSYKKGYYSLDNNNFSNQYGFITFWKYLGESYSVPTRTDVITVTGGTTDSDSGVDKYFFRVDNGEWLPQEGITPTSTQTKLGKVSYKFEGLTPGTAYNVEMKAVDRAENERISNPIPGRTYVELIDATSKVKSNYHFQTAMTGEEAMSMGVMPDSYNINDTIYISTDKHFEISMGPQVQSYTLRKGYYRCINSTTQEEFKETEGYWDFAGKFGFFCTEYFQYLGETYLVPNE